MKSFRGGVGILIVAGALMVTSAAAASPHADVDNLVVIAQPDIFLDASASNFAGGTGPHNATLYQTWTSGSSASLVGLQLFESSSEGDYGKTISIFSGGSSSAIGTTLLGKITLPNVALPFNNPSIDTYDLSSLNLAVVAGQTYTFELSLDVCASACGITWRNWVGAEVNGKQVFMVGDYAGGSAFDQEQGQPLVPLGDLNFRILVDGGGVPEPSAWSLLIIGFGSIGAALRRLNRRTAKALW